MKGKTVCFIGHRKVELGEAETLKLKILIENLIVKENVCVFLFGSRSDFDYLCHEIVTELKEKYSNIKRKRYTCTSESCVLEHEREHYEKLYSCIQKREVRLLGFEEEVEFKDKWKAGKASYVERNQAMINDSDLCVFYYDENYKVDERKYSKRSFTTYQPKSGTRLAYEYAKQKKKEIINVFNKLK